ncbi:MAG: dipeptide ABC transporter ATP-binding protein [Clostridia bacterium]|nr:dipeptide ABC transporter ATP-binding protein [Clostridia bacterium]
MEKTENGEVLETESAEKAEAALPDDVLLQVNDLKKYFPVAKNFFGKPIKFLKAVDGISFTLKKGKTLGIVGESGCGKSTMGRSLLRLYDGVQGEILFEGQDVAKLKNREFDKLRPNMQMIFQDPYASLSPRLTVGEIIGESARQHHLVDKAGFHDYVLKVMDMCGLQPHYFERYPHEFSGGQRQRICIARALALQPKLVVCDEPVSALDVSIQAQVINMLIELREKLGLTYIFISHDLSVVKHISDDVGVMYLGNIVEYGSKESVFSHTLHPYTKALFSAVPVPNPHVKMNRIMLKGDIPSPVNPPKGCKFHTRCEHCMEICSRIAPEYREVEDGHFCSCHLYNSEEDTLRLLAQAEVNERNEAIAAEKEANKPWNKAKAKVVTTFNNVVAKVKNKFKKSEDAEQTEQTGEQQAQLVEEVKEVAPDTTDETAVTAAETTAEEQTVAEVKVKVKVPSGKKVPEVKVEVSVPSEQETEEVKAPAKKKTTRSSTPKKDNVEKK